MNTELLFKYSISLPLRTTWTLNVKNDINSTLWLVLLTEVTELKVMIPTAAVTVTRRVYTSRKESDHHKEARKGYSSTGVPGYSCWGTHNFEYSRHSAWN